MRAALAYSPRPGPARTAPGRWIAAAFLGSFAFVAFAFSNPLVLPARRRGRRVAGLGVGAGARLRRRCAGRARARP